MYMPYPISPHPLMPYHDFSGPCKQMEPPEKEFMVCALDLLSGMSEGLGGGFGALLANSNLLQMLLQVWSLCRVSSVVCRVSRVACHASGVACLVLWSRQGTYVSSSTVLVAPSGVPHRRTALLLESDFNGACVLNGHRRACVPVCLPASAQDRISVHCISMSWQFFPPCSVIDFQYPDLQPCSLLLLFVVVRLLWGQLNCSAAEMSRWRCGSRRSRWWASWPSRA